MTSLLNNQIFSVLIIREDNSWSAQCLEYDIAIQSKTLKDIPLEFEKTLEYNIIVCEQLNIKPFTHDRAPNDFHTVYKENAFPIQLSDKININYRIGNY